MADVTPPEWLLRNEKQSGQQRGQMILLSGLVLATTLVALVLILNSAIYTENLATRNDGASANDAIEYRENARQGIAGAIEHVNRYNNSSQESLNTSLKDEAAEWNSLALQHVALDGRAANVTVDTDDITWGTRIGQNGNRNFTNRTGYPSWTLARNVDDTDLFRLDVNRSGLGTEKRFGIRFANNSNNWDIWINRSNSSEIKVEGPSGATCSIENRRAELDIVAGTIRNGTNGTIENCPAVDFIDSIDGSYRIQYGNAANITGSYEISVDKDYREIDRSDYFDAPTSTAPYASWTIREATISVSYESPSLRYESNVTVEPHDPGTIRPTENATS